MGNNSAYSDQLSFEKYYFQTLISYSDSNYITMHNAADQFSVDKKIILLRNQRVILDVDVARLYDVQTREINQAVKNNPEKFPQGYIFQLSRDEKTEVIKIFDHLALKYSPSSPYAFTEKGLYMLATILRGEKATQTSLAIIETFASLKELSRNLSVLSVEQDDHERRSILEKSSEMISDLLSDGMPLNETETTIEINLAVLKLKHTLKKKRDNKDYHE